MTTLTIGIRQLRELVTPVMPFASTDPMLPILSAVQIETSGRWLVATATDRFRLVMNREGSPDGDWPDWSAVIPTSTLRNILTTFKPLRGLDTDLTLTVEENKLEVTAAGLLDMSEATIAYRLTDGEYPKVKKIIRTALAAVVSDAQTGLNPALLRDLPKSPALRFKITSPSDPVLFTDGENLVGCIMPRRLVSSDPAGRPFVSLDNDWMDGILAATTQSEPERVSA